MHISLTRQDILVCVENMKLGSTQNCVLYYVVLTESNSDINTRDPLAEQSNL